MSMAGELLTDAGRRRPPGRPGGAGSVGDRPAGETAGDAIGLVRDAAGGTTPLPSTADEVSAALGRGTPAPATAGRPGPRREATSGATAAEWGSTLTGSDLVPLWQLHNTYIFCPVKGGALIVDQHVAHERILYEQALAHLGEHEAGSQSLIFPETIDLPPDEIDVLDEALPGLERLGFDLRVSGPRSVTVHGLPAGIQRWERGRFLVDLLHTLSDERGQGAGYAEAIAASYACHAAIRKGDALTLEEMNRLVDDLFACEVPEACPHGRPILVKMPLEELDRRFGRS
jgi:DNA mismatch repair ATPase MutL